MKKIIRKILGMTLTLIFSYQVFSYADVILIEPIDKFKPITLLIGFIGVIVLVVSTISFFALKAKIKRQKNSENDKEEINSLSEEEIAKKKNSIQSIFYVWGIIFSIIGLIYLWLSDELSIITFFIPVILVIASFTFRLHLISFMFNLKNNKKISNIICGIAVTFVCIIVLWNVVPNMIIKNYNEQFLQYKEPFLQYNNGFTYYYASDVEGLINTAIKNNKTGKKVTIIYQDTNYTSVDELKQLLNELNTDQNYCMGTTYDNHYIESIILSKYVRSYPYLIDILEYDGEQRSGSRVNDLIQLARVTVAPYEDLEEVKITITYTSEMNQSTTIDVTTSNSAEISNLMEQISNTKLYDIEIKSYNPAACDIIITSND